MTEVDSVFQKTLKRIGQSEEETIPVSIFYNLSGPSHSELQLFEKEWPTIALQRRRHIIHSLVEIAELSFEVDFNALFRFCLHDEDAEVRAQAIEGLWEDEDIALAHVLIQLLETDASALVREAAAASLGRFVLLVELGKTDRLNIKQVTRPLLDRIHDPGEGLSVRRRAVESIAYSGEKVVRGVIEDAYHHEEELMRVSAVFAMGRSADPYWNKTVLSELDNSNPAMRYEAARACGELAYARAVPTLTRLIDDPDREVQQVAIWAIAQIGGPEARRVLEECCSSDDEVICEAAEEALAEMALIGNLDHMPLYDFNDEDFDVDILDLN
ncbi:MAG: HEAT repeat domain-containing protein [Anaerolineae bacterium]